jgi:serine protease Do
MKYRGSICLLTLAAGLFMGFIIASRLNVEPNADALTLIGASEKQGPAIKEADNDVSPAQRLEESFIEVAAKTGPAVVSISTERVSKIKGRVYQNPFEGDDYFERFFRNFFYDMPEREYAQRGLGSGVIIDETGYILTNEHVIREADRITVTLTDGREFKGEVKGRDERSDLAVIKIEAEHLPYAKLGDSDKVKIGQWAIAIGNPFGYAVQSAEPTVTVGVISALDRSLPVSMERDYSGLIQTDAAINPGNSGGPLVNINGEMIGINVAIFSTTGGYQGIGFAIPVNTAKEILNILIDGGKVLYGWLGVSVQDIDDKLADYFKLADRQGVIVVKILPESPAQQAKLREGDVIRMFDGKKIKDLKSLVRIVSHTEVGREVIVRVLRDNKEIPVAVKIGERPSGLETQSPQKPLSTEPAWRGMEIADITQDIAQRYRLDKVSGVVVVNVENQSPAYEAGIVQGDIIERINNKPVSTAAEFMGIASSVTGDALIKTNRGFVVVNANGRNE